MKIKYCIKIEFMADEGLPDDALQEVAADCFVQLESLTDDYGEKYDEAHMTVNRGAEFNEGDVVKVLTAMMTHSLSLSPDEANKLDAILKAGADKTHMHDFLTALIASDKAQKM